MRFAVHVENKVGERVKYDIDASNPDDARKRLVSHLKPHIVKILKVKVKRNA